MPVSRSLPAALLLALPFAAAGQVYKCVDRSGASYQSEPCGAGQVTARTWQAVEPAPAAVDGPARMDADERPPPRRDARLRAATRRGTATRTTAGAGTVSTIGACEAARQQRDRKLAAMGKAGHKLDARRAADAAVAAACR